MPFQVSNVPITVKMRTGIYEKHWTAHDVIPRVREWGASIVTVCNVMCLSVSQGSLNQLDKILLIRDSFHKLLLVLHTRINKIIIFKTAEM